MFVDVVFFQLSDIETMGTSVDAVLAEKLQRDIRIAVCRNNIELIIMLGINQSH